MHIMGETSIEILVVSLSKTNFPGFDWSQMRGREVGLGPITETSILIPPPHPPFTVHAYVFTSRTKTVTI